MKRKTIIIITILLVLLFIASATYARTTKTVEKKPGVARRFFDGVVCLFQCGWPAWLFIVLIPAAVWFYTWIWHVF